ncbi:hypothetical protein PLICRDRAFT_49171 [Plicaturopsis crispa FD-325 SS-3]|nr:hypothetical protein PLICRDRAFT_49171 [Plicaturopsis crispa FD-325 SS-3]
MSESLNPSNGPSLPQQSPSETRAFDRWRKKIGVITGMGLTEEERSSEMQRMHHQTCEERKTFLMNNSPNVIFMLKHLKLSGCDVKSENIPCMPCDMTRAGGFQPDIGAVVLCQGHYFSKKHMEDTLVHELIHMYDHCKFKVDWGNLRHHACSEIRANSLSGDCKFSRELRRGFVAFSKQHQACARRRAVLSVQSNPNCPDKETAERAVNEVWDSCFNDTRPYDEIY